MSKVIRVNNRTHELVLQKAAETGCTAGRYVERLLLASWLVEQMKDNLIKAAAGAIAGQGVKGELKNDSAANSKS